MTEPLVFNGIDIVIQHDHLLECFYDRMQWARHDNDFNVLLSRATAEVLARHIEKLNDERVTLLAETGATITDLEIQVERLRQERRDVTQWRDQTLAAENERLREAQERAERVVQMPCESCVKGCDEDCWSNILLRVLRQQPATRCPMCSEWWDGPVEEDGGSPILSAKQIECPFCTKLEAAAQAVEEK
uniref:Uncharacterized protein n=1 Tax=viral metagenome TaxID=1070528 RepID=A0A6M3L3Z8_9ZZZZ